MYQRKCIFISHRKKHIVHLKLKKLVVFVGNFPGHLLPGHPWKSDNYKIN